MSARAAIIRDLSAKCSDDVQAAVRRVWQFAESTEEMMELGLMAAASALAYASAATQSHLKADDCTPAEVTDALWAMLRPMALKILGGGDGEFRQLLARVEAAQADKPHNQEP